MNGWFIKEENRILYMNNNSKYMKIQIRSSSQK